MRRVHAVENVIAEVQRLVNEHDRYGLLSELARYVGVSRTTTGKWAEGSYPSEQWHARIAEFFGLSPDHLALVSDGSTKVGAAASAVKPESKTRRIAGALRRPHPREDDIQSEAELWQSQMELFGRIDDRFADLERRLPDDFIQLRDVVRKHGEELQELIDTVETLQKQTEERQKQTEERFARLERRAGGGPVAR